MVEFCAPQRKKMLHPIIDWEEWEVWKFIEGAGLRYCRLYDEGFKRIGCVGCPLAGVRMMKYEFRRWPHFEKMYRKAFEKMIEERKKAGLPEYWKTSEDCMKWWLKEKKIKSPKYIEQKLLLEVPEWP